MTFFFQINFHLDLKSNPYYIVANFKIIERVRKICYIINTMKHGCSHSGSHSGYAIIQKYFIWSLLEWSHECILPILLSFDSLFFKLIIITLREIYVEHLLYAWKCRENIMAIISFNSHNSPMRLVLFFHIFPEEEINMRQIKWHKQGHRPASGMSRVNFFFFIPEKMSF